MSSSKVPGPEKTALLPPREDIEALINARHRDPFAVLGPHPDGAGGQVIRAFLPGALSVKVVARDSDDVIGTLDSTEVPGLFAARLPMPAAIGCASTGPGASRPAKILTVLVLCWGKWTCICLQKVIIAT